MPRKLAGPDRRDGGEKKNAGGKPSIEGSSSSSKAKRRTRTLEARPENARSPSKRLDDVVQANGKNAQLVPRRNKKEGRWEADAQPFVEMAPPRAGILAHPEWSSCRTKAGEWSIEFRSRSVRSCLFLLALFVNNASSHWMRQIV